jgi:hypothetical protein
MEANADINSAVFEVEGMGVALGAVANDANFLGFDEFRIDVFFVIDSGHG